MQTLKEVNDFFKQEAVLQNLKDENERLRIALERAADSLRDAHALDAWAEACKALGEKE
jgi:hypothetical protein